MRKQVTDVNRAIDDVESPSAIGSGRDETRFASLRDQVDRLLTGEIEVGSFPGAVYAIGDARGIRVENALGHAALKPAKIKTSLDTIYDVASLTKPLITSTLVLRAAAEGLLDLGDRVAKHMPELRETDKRDVTFIDLLTHRGGFQAWYPLYTAGMSDRAYLQALVQRPLRYAPGTREIYSCLGFILLHLALERITGKRAEDLAAEKIFAPLGLTRSLFNPPPEMKYTIAATEWGNGNERLMVAERGLTFPHFRNYLIWGEVNDGNAYYMGGMGGNAGLFSTAREIFSMARSHLSRDERLLPASMIDRSLRNYTVGLEENRGLGWQLPSLDPDGPTAMLSLHSFGHTGFTGTSVWIDPDRDLIMVLLTNRVHPSVQPISMQKIRRKFHLLVASEWDR
ncbi:MAG TPA: serine hydrolase domain-containing protein [Thermoanaerobaculia bacterium]|nr:serine hydrolase domain-containing protein [Thermoanaerobaculia bacterium]